jgi:hypothetical protein
MSVYALVASLGGGNFDNFATSFGVVSGAEVFLRMGDLLLCLTGLLLVMEWAKSSDTTRKGMIDVGLSIILMCVAWVFFFTWEPFGTATWLILCFIQSADAIGGGWVSVEAARRDFGAD